PKPQLRKQLGFCFGRSKIPALLATLNKLPLREFDTKCFCIFAMVQHIFTRIDLYPQDAASTFSNEML
ncbi:hypothetical protein, partial [Pseudomonas lactis]|uniref:hypothetical protein n=1 Tax=Pseudomonas lactis TaxID=1615674 RepID=UPI002592A763